MKFQIPISLHLEDRGVVILSKVSSNLCKKFMLFALHGACEANL